MGVAALATLALIYSAYIVLPNYAPWAAVGLIAAWALRWWGLALCLLGPGLVPFIGAGFSGEEHGVSLARVFALFKLAGFILNWQQARGVLAAVPARFWTALMCFGGGYLLATAVDISLHPGRASLSLTFAGGLALRLWIWVGSVVACLLVRDLRLILLGWIFFGAMMLGASVLLQITTGDVLAVRGEVAAGVGGGGNIAALVAGVGFLSVAGGAACFSWGRGISLLWLISGAAMIATTIFSGRRQALLGAVLTVFLCFGIARNWRSLILGGVCFTAAFILFKAGPLAEFLERRESVQAELLEGKGRIELLELARTYIRTASVPQVALGLGLGGHSRFAAEQSVVIEGIGVAAHNEFSGALMEGGLLALIGAILLAGEFFRVLWAARLGYLAAARRELTLVFFIAAAGVLISAMLTSNFITHTGYALLGGGVLGAGYRVMFSQNARGNRHLLSSK